MGDPRGELIVAHCPQIMHFADYQNAFVLRRLKSYDNRRAVFTGPASKVTQSQLRHVGINVTQRGRCWHIDVAASRCFPCQSKDPDYMFAIRPSALQINRDGTKQVLVASRGLPRNGPPDGGIPTNYPLQPISKAKMWTQHITLFFTNPVSANVDCLCLVLQNSVRCLNFDQLKQRGLVQMIN